MIDFESIIHIAHAAETASHAAEVIGEAAPASEGVIGTLGINAKLFIAQLFNFGIALVVLWKWVFTPITKRLQERSRLIEESLQTAEAVAHDKQEFETWKQQEIVQTRIEASEIINKAKADAEAAKGALMEETRKEQELITSQAKQQLILEQQKAISAIKEHMASLVVQATQTILQEKLDPEHDKAIIKKALEQIK